ncbi:N-terminal acetyltransferase A, auxiliary subunit [Thalictrum thalictroides]|uniref:N-terminal acetyltransferase A, auxiliary subunit n=1 Tax=Thalictrum thalictroides TaxID=46969 RepID=A0A7J6UTU9_THATH|nr:N-terminal acetyltransferase A, auxiliary subunit [Thalictrum thalictroides]
MVPSVSTTPNCRKKSIVVVKASVNESEPSKSQSGGEGGEGKEENDEYEVELDQLYGLKFAKGRDGGTYIEAIAPRGSADKSKMFTVGDKVLATRFNFQYILFCSLHIIACNVESV